MRSHQIYKQFFTAAAGVAMTISAAGCSTQKLGNPAGAMEPTLAREATVSVDTKAYQDSPPARGDVIAYYPPRGPMLLAGVPTDAPFFSRVIGLPGETVEVSGGSVLINGSALTEPYVAEPPTYTYPAVEIPAGKYFVLGDNRNLAHDSKDWGFLPVENVIGQVALD